MVKNKSDVWLTFTPRGSLKLAKEWNYRGCLPFLSPQTAACRATALRCLQTTAILAAVMEAKNPRKPSGFLLQNHLESTCSSTLGDFGERSKAAWDVSPTVSPALDNNPRWSKVVSLRSLSSVAEPLTSAVPQFQGQCLPGLEALAHTEKGENRLQ